ncbi:MAG: AN1-type zinc finger domain-containing protein [archaeon]
MSCADPECPGSDALPYECRRCGREFCSDHRLPENHDCSGLPGTHNARPEQWFSNSTGGSGQDGKRESLLRRYLWLVVLVCIVVVAAFVLL